MPEQIPLSCNIRFHPGNEYHRRAAEALALVGARQKTAFVTLAVLEYLDNHPVVDAEGIQRIQKASWGTSSRKVPAPPPRAPQPAPMPVLEKHEEPVSAAQDSPAPDAKDWDKDVLDEALDFYDIG